jgi:hypothetical protein
MKIDIKYIVLATVLLTSCAVKQNVSQWQSKPLKIDGIPSEYTTPLSYFDEDSKVQYTLSNDLENLYFCIRATDEEPQLKILQAGIQISIDTAGDGKNPIILMYPLPIERKSPPPFQNGIASDSLPINPVQFSTPFGKNEMRLIGFKVPSQEKIPIINSYGIKVAIQIDSLKYLTYEGAIPFKTFYKDRLQSTDNLKKFSIVITLNAMESPQRPSLQQDRMANDFQKKPQGQRPSGAPLGNRNMSQGGGMPHSDGEPQGDGGFQGNESQSMQNTVQYSFRKVQNIKINYRLSVL